MRTASLFSIKTSPLRLSFITANAGDVSALLAESFMLSSFMNTEKRLVLLPDHQNVTFVTKCLFYISQLLEYNSKKWNLERKSRH